MARDQKTAVVVFPFDAFGAGGTGHGAELLGDALQEILDDNRQETRKIRSDCYSGKVKLHEVTFDTAKALSTWRSLGRQTLRQSLKSGDRVIWLGGNHLSVLPVYEELGGEGAAAKTLVLQFDAHLDVYQLHDVNMNPAPGNFLLHSDETLPAIMNIGHRDLFLTSAETSNYFSQAYSSLDVASHTEKVIADVRARAKKAKRVWIDIDVDVFDSSRMPATHSPMPFGVDPLTLLRILDAAWSGNVIGVSLSEFDPGRDIGDRGLNLLGWLIEWFLLRWYEQPDDDEAE